MYGTGDLFIINNNRCSLLLGDKSITSTDRFSFQIELFSVLIRHLSKMWHKPTQNFISGHLHLILLVNGLMMLVNGLMIRMWILLLIKTIVFWIEILLSCSKKRIMLIMIIEMSIVMFSWITVNGSWFRIRFKSTTHWFNKSLIRLTWILYLIELRLVRCFHSLIIHRIYFTFVWLRI
jgi:hypothetical protein